MVGAIVKDPVQDPVVLKEYLETVDQGTRRMEGPLPRLQGADLTMTTIFGIRHHGPGCARSLLAALDALAPDVVLLKCRRRWSRCWCMRRTRR